MYTFSESLILHKRNWGHAGITFLWHFEKFLQVKEARSIRFHGSCINGAHEKMYFVKDICYIFQLLVLAISHPNYCYIALCDRYESKNRFIIFFILICLTIIFKSFFSNNSICLANISFLMIQFISVITVSCSAYSNHYLGCCYPSRTSTSLYLGDWKIFFLLHENKKVLFY